MTWTVLSFNKEVLIRSTSGIQLMESTRTFAHTCMSRINIFKLNINVKGKSYFYSFPNIPRVEWNSPSSQTYTFG